MQVVCAVITNSEGKIFAARRAEGKSFEGYWEFPGGKVEEGEEADQALARELEEELGLSLMIGASIHKLAWENKSGAFELEAFHISDELAGLKLQDHDKYDWFSIEELLGIELMVADIALLSHIEKFLGA
mgnify:CR=1 FL=1